MTRLPCGGQVGHPQVCTSTPSGWATLPDGQRRALEGSWLLAQPINHLCYPSQGAESTRQVTPRFPAQVGAHARTWCPMLMGAPTCSPREALPLATQKWVPVLTWSVNKL